MNKKLLLFAVAFLLSTTASVAQTNFRASLDNLQASTAATAASGTGVCVLSADRTRVDFQVTVTGLTGPITVAHFHVGATGVVGPVVRDLSFVNNTVAGVWRSADTRQPLTPALVDSLLQGRLYFMIHTVANPLGEIRGQILPITAPQLGFAIALDTAQAAVTGTVVGRTNGARARGTAWVVLNADSSQLFYQMTVTGLTDTVTVAHFHFGARGQRGGVARDIHPRFITRTTGGNGTARDTVRRTDATQPFSIAFRDSLLFGTGNIYINVHTTANPGGEIRGQLSRVATGSLSVRQVETRVTPDAFALSQNYPNPFNPSTVISYQVGATSAVSLKIYDLLGREVQTLVNERQTAGRYEVSFSASNLPSGLYFYRLQAGAFSETRKMTLLK